MSGGFAFIWLQQFEIDILHSAPSAPSLCSMITPCPRDQRPWFGGHNFFPFWKTGFQRSLPWFHNQREQFGHNYIPPIRGHDIGVDFRPPKSPENKCPKMAIFGHKKRNFQKKTVVTADKEGLSMGGLVLIFLLEVPRWSLDVGWVGGVNFSGSLARSFLKQRASSLP